MKARFVFTMTNCLVPCASRAKTKRETVPPIVDFSRRRMANLMKYTGTCRDLMTVDELQAQRQQRVQALDCD